MINESVEKLYYFCFLNSRILSGLIKGYLKDCVEKNSENWNELLFEKLYTVCAFHYIIVFILLKFYH